MHLTTALKNAMLMLGQIHVLGAESDLMSSARNNIQAVITAFENVEKEENQHENHDDQREDV